MTENKSLPPRVSPDRNSKRDSGKSSESSRSGKVSEIKNKPISDKENREMEKDEQGERFGSTEGSV